MMGGASWDRSMDISWVINEISIESIANLKVSFDETPSTMISLLSDLLFLSIRLFKTLQFRLTSNLKPMACEYIYLNPVASDASVGRILNTNQVLKTNWPQKNNA